MKVPIIIDSRVEDSDNEEKVFPKPVVEDRNIEFAKKCTELISDWSRSPTKKSMKNLRASAFVPDTLTLKNVSDSISETKYKEAGKKGLSESLYKMMPAAIDTAFAKEVSKLQSEVLYRQKYDAEKGKSNYAQMQEPPDMKHAKEVNKHQSNVSYKKDALDIHKYTEVLDRLDIQKATEAAKFISKIEYKKGREDMKKEPVVLGRPDFEHGKEVSKLSSQVKYKEKFDKEMKGKKPCYNPLDSASFKQAQVANALASNVKYRKHLQDIHDPSVDMPNLLHLQHALKTSKMQSNNMYKKQFEENKGMYNFALNTAEQIHHKENAVLQSQVKYKEKFEKSKGRSLLECIDIPSYQVSKEAQKIQGEKENRKDLEEGIKGKGLTVLEDTPDLIRVKNAAQILNEICRPIPNMCKEYRKDFENNIKGKGMEFSNDIPEMIRAKRASEISSQKKYKDEAEKLLSTYSIIADTPEIARVKTTQKNISSVKYKDDIEPAMAIPDLPEVKRVKEIQKNISNVQYKEQQFKATPVTVTPEMERVKYSNDLKQLKGRPSIILDTPEMKETQNHTSMVGCLGGFTPVVDDPITDRVRKNTQIVSDAAYKNAHPHVVEMDRRSVMVVGPGMPGAYLQHHSGYGYMHQSSASSVRSAQSQHAQPLSPSMRTYRAMYDYCAQDEDEVSFREGDYIVNVQPIDEGWMYGTVQRSGKNGMLPANYIELVN
ncbi:hypothetical protein XELAEV_18030802mg [Xenopus laevis]|uniref:SH3 domain-containing protein n=1 Tax=Xenopus laevis TaxID=8355 RepID=A0A974HF48_XENLA|nr:hypothetical protein XELAEV_18030802mg [Xenopus laevis]